MDGMPVMTEVHNATCSNISHFTLGGVPNLGDSTFWFGFPLCLLYIVALLGNIAVLYVIRVNQELHGPMYIFLFMLSTVELIIATAVIPQMLRIFWFDNRQITFDLCLTQMFFLHLLSALESGVLVSMAIDRYVAICYPLRYTSILTKQTITKMALVILVRGLAVIPIILFIRRLLLWRSNHLEHSYCLHQEVMNLACTDIKVNYFYGLFFILLVMGVDSLFISISYLMIIKTVVCRVEETSLMAISTCASHICAVLVYYIPLIGLSILHRQSNGTVSNLHILFGNVYLLLPPVINPLVYGIKTKQIRLRLKKLFSDLRSQSKTTQEL